MVNWLESLLADNGYWVVFLVVFLNNLGIPIPGDTMLLAGGFLAQKGILSLGATAAVGTAACFLGGCAGYGLGLKLGRRFLKRIPWLKGSPERVRRIEYFFGKYGAKGVFLARFVALLHPLTGFLAGMGKTPFRPFLFYNLAGSAVYALIYTLIGYFFGQRWEGLKTLAGPILLYVLIVVAVLVALVFFLRRSIQNFLAGFAPPKISRRKGK